MSQDHEIAIRIRAIMENLAALDVASDKIEDVGDSSTQASKEAALLSAEFKRLSNTQSLLNNFRDLKKETKATDDALGKAREEAARLAKEFKATNTPAKALATNFGKAKTAVKDLKAASQQQRIELQNLRGKLTGAGVDTKKLSAESIRLKKALEGTSKSARTIGGHLDKAGKSAKTAGTAMDGGFSRADVSGDKLNTTVSSVRNSLLALVSIAGLTRLSKEVLAGADAWKGYEAQLDLSTETQEEFNTAQEGLFEVSQNTRTSIGDNIALYSKLARSQDELNVSQQDMIDLTDLVAKSFKISGASQSESANATRQLAQAMASGVLRGDELNSILENGSRIGLALADSLGVTIGELRAMGEAGKLSAEVVTKALLQQKEVIDEEFNKLPETVDGAVQRITNAWQKWIAEVDRTAGFSQKIVDGLNYIADNFDQLAATAEKVGKVIIAIFAVKAVAAVRSYVVQLIAAEAAQLAVGASATTMAGGVGKAAAATAALSSIMKKAGWVGLALSLYEAVSGLKEYYDITQDVKDSQALLAETTANYEEALAQLSNRLGVTIKSMEDINRLEKEGVIVWDKIAKQWELAGTALTKLGESAADVSKSLADVEKKAQQQADKVASAFEDLGIKSSAAVKKMEEEVIFSFDAIAFSGKSTPEEIRQAFDASFAKLSTIEGLRKLEERLKVLALMGGDIGKAAAEGLEELNRAIQAVDVDPIAQAFHDAGLKTKAELVAMGTAALNTFNTIKESGEATPRQLEAAWTRFAKIAIDANGGVVDAALRANAEMNGMSQVLQSLEGGFSQLKATATDTLQAIVDGTLRGVEAEKALLELLTQERQTREANAAAVREETKAVAANNAEKSSTPTPPITVNQYAGDGGGGSSGGGALYNAMGANARGQAKALGEEYLKIFEEALIARASRAGTGGYNDTKGIMQAYYEALETAKLAKQLDDERAAASEERAAASNERAAASEVRSSALGSGGAAPPPAQGQILDQQAVFDNLARSLDASQAHQRLAQPTETKRIVIDMRGQEFSFDDLSSQDAAQLEALLDQLASDSQRTVN